MASNGGNSAGALLEIMTVRVRMQEAGTTHPPASVKTATRELVARLRSIPADERIAFSIQEHPPVVRYVREKTGEVLAEIQPD